MEDSELFHNLQTTMSSIGHIHAFLVVIDLSSAHCDDLHPLTWATDRLKPVFAEDFVEHIALVFVGREGDNEAEKRHRKSGTLLHTYLLFSF